MDPSYAPLSESCAKLLCDKTYEKRKAAALEIEKYKQFPKQNTTCFILLNILYMCLLYVYQNPTKYMFMFILLLTPIIIYGIPRMVAEFNKNNNTTQISKLLRVLDADFLRSPDSQKKKGGLIALASAGIGLGKVCLVVINLTNVFFLIVFIYIYAVGLGEVHQRASRADSALPAGPGRTRTILCQRVVVQCCESSPRSDFAVVPGYFLGDVSPLYGQESVGEKRQRVTGPVA